MNEHLTSKQILKQMLGEGTADEARHVRFCEQCGAELARLESTLSQFRQSVRNTSAAPVPAWNPYRTPARASRHPLRLALVLAAMVVMAVVPVYRSASERHRAAVAREDALLLERVDAQISRKVPAAMEPLMKLMSQDYQDGDTQ